MNIYIVRHGKAFDIGEKDIVRDEDRMLTSKGASRTYTMGTMLRNLECTPEVLLSSPFRRALETAEIIKETLAFEEEITFSDKLTPSVPPQQTVEMLQGFPKVTSMVVVGHLPNLSLLASYLLTRSVIPGLLLKKSAICCISFEETIVAGEGLLEWLLQPRQTRALTALQ
jgi:phosphohistidine phosphatase